MRLLQAAAAAGDDESEQELQARYEQKRKRRLRYLAEKKREHEESEHPNDDEKVRHLEFGTSRSGSRSGEDFGSRRSHTEELAEIEEVLKEGGMPTRASITRYFKGF